MSTDRPTPTRPAAPELRILEQRVYRGANAWSYAPAVHLTVDLGVLEDYPSDTLPGFTDQLLEILPGLEGHTCSRGHRGGFIERLREGTWLGHVSEHVALQLQQEVGHDMRRGKTRGDVGAGAEAGIDEAPRFKGFERRGIGSEMRRLTHRRAIAVDPEPVEIGQRRCDIFLTRTAAVDIVDTNAKAAAGAARRRMRKRGAIGVA